MLQNEFEKLTGLKVTHEEFVSINAMYETADQSINKEFFCDDWMKHKDSVLLNDYYNQARFYEKKVKDLKKEIEDGENLLAAAMTNHLKKLDEVKRSTAEFLADMAEEYSDARFARKAIELIGMKDFVAYKIQNGYTLYVKDRDFILEQMGATLTIKENVKKEQAVEFDEVV